MGWALMPPAGSRSRRADTVVVVARRCCRLVRWQSGCFVDPAEGDRNVVFTYGWQVEDRGPAYTMVVDQVILNHT